MFCTCIRTQVTQVTRYKEKNPKFIVVYPSTGLCAFLKMPSVKRI
jgi:hypothetical protein